MALGIPNVFAQTTGTRQGGSPPTTSRGPTNSRTPAISGPSLSPVPATRAQYQANTPSAQPIAQQTTSPFTLPFNPSIPFDLGSQLGSLIQLDPQAEADRNMRNALWDAQLRRSRSMAGADAGSLRAGYDADMARLGLRDQEIGIKREGLNRQNPLIDVLFGGREGQRSNAETYLGKIKVQSQADYDQAMKWLDEEIKAVDNKTASDTRTQRSAATAAGAVVTQGNRDALSDIDFANKFGKGKIENERIGAKSSLTREMASIEKQYSDVGFQRRMDEAQTAEDRIKIFDQMRLLDLEAEEVGITRTELAAKLSSGLGKINSSYSDLDQLLSAAMSGDPYGVEKVREAYAAGRF